MTQLFGIANSVVALPENIPANEFLQCPRCFESEESASDIVVDLDALIEKIDEQINEPPKPFRPIRLSPYLAFVFYDEPTGNDVGPHLWVESRSA